MLGHLLRRGFRNTMRVHYELARSQSTAMPDKRKPGGYMGISDRRNILKSGLVVLGGGMLADVSSLAALQEPKTSAPPSKAASGANGACNCEHAADGTLFDIG